MRVITQSFIESDPAPTGRHNHGRVWTLSQREELRRLWHEGTPTKDICDGMGRSYRSIVLKLEYFKLVKFDPMTGSYHSVDEVQVEPSAVHQQTKENIMAANIETKVFINGADASGLSDNQIFQHIAKLEMEMDKLIGIRAKSVKKDAAIAALQADIDALVAYVDARESKT